MKGDDFMRIALIAHDKKKNEMIELAKEYKEVLDKHGLYATGTTGALVMGETGLTITRLKSGPLGGDQQIGAMIAEGKIDVLIFFCDNMITQGHQQDVGALSRLASLYNIAFAKVVILIVVISLYSNPAPLVFKTW